MKNNKVLIVAAHPDDEILGCGATIAKLVKEGFEAHTLILGEGKTSRYLDRNEYKFQEIEDLDKEAILANKEIGVENVIFANLPDNKFDSLPLLEVVKIIEKIKEEIKPRFIFTHYANDLNVDHRVTYKSVLTATRPMEGETTEKIYSFEILSSTEWNYPTSFSPNVFFDVSETLEKKLNAMKHYSSELREYPHPRSIDAIKILASHNAYRVGINGFCEAFVLVRDIIK